MNKILAVVLFVVGIAINVIIIEPTFGLLAMAPSSGFIALVAMITWNGWVSAWLYLKTTWREACKEVDER